MMRRMNRNQESAGTWAVCPAGREGFTLVEIMMVLMILTVGVLPIAVIQHQAREEVSEADRYTQGIEVAQMHLERIKGMGFGNAAADSGYGGQIAVDRPGDQRGLRPGPGDRDGNLAERRPGRRRSPWPTSCPCADEGMGMNKMNSMKQTDRRGLTLTELMIALAIFGVIMVVIFGFLSGARNSYSDTRERAQYQQSMRAVMSLVTREIRSAGCDPTGAGFDNFGVADDDRISCRMDLNGDCGLHGPGPDENITYTFVGGQPDPEQRNRRPGDPARSPGPDVHLFRRDGHRADGRSAECRRTGPWFVTWASTSRAKPTAANP